MNDKDIKRGMRIKKSVDELGLPSVGSEDIEWIMEKFFEVLPKCSQCNKPVTQAEIDACEKQDFPDDLICERCATEQCMDTIFDANGTK